MNTPFVVDQHIDDYFPFIGWDNVYDNIFYKYIDLLNLRTQRLNELPIDSTDYETYRDICLIMIRSILMETNTRKGNYTLQNYLTSHERIDLKDAIEDYLDQKVNSLYSLREAIKNVVDKSLAHFDSLIADMKNNEKELNVEHLLKKTLFLLDIKREEYPFTIQKVVNVINDAVNEIRQ